MSNNISGMDGAISRMAREIVTAMDGKVYGIWLYGSAVLDDFRPGWSDIDLIALTDGEISEGQAKKLLTLRQQMMNDEPGNPYYRSFEGIIASLGEYRRQRYRRLVYWGTGGQRIACRYSPDAFSGFELAKYGKPVYGGKPWILPAPGREELVGAVRAHYDSIRRYAVCTNDSIYSCGWLLDIARCIYTLRYNDVTGKTQAGFWALENRLFPDEAPLRKTLEIRLDPLAFKDDEGTKQWLKSLGPVVQRYADVLEQELSSASLPGPETVRISGR